MSLDSFNSLASRLLFGLAFVLLAAALAEKLANVVGYTLLGGEVAPSQLLGWAGTLLAFVIAVLLRQIRERLPAR